MCGGDGCEEKSNNSVCHHWHSCYKYNDYIQLPPLKKDTPSDVVAFMWKYMKVPENSREKVKNLLKDANENGVKLSHQAPTLYDVVPKMEIK